MSVSATAVADGSYYLKACDKHRAPKKRPGARGPAAYELDAVAAGEPPGQWAGPGARRLQLVGDIVPGEASGDEFATVVNSLVLPRTGEKLGSRPRRFRTAEELVRAYRLAHPDATPEQVAEEKVRAAGKKRKAVHAYDLGFGLPKSWSVLHAALEREGRTEDAAQVWEAINAGITAALDQAADEFGWTRKGVGGPRVHGQVTTTHVHAPDWTMAIFRHHTSRDRDPQLHAHVMLLNRVQLPDGSWKAIHAAPLMKAKHQLDATFLRVAEAELAERLGYAVATRPDGKAREVVGVSAEVRDLFSSRSRALTTRARELADEYEARWQVAPSPFVRWSMLQYAARDTRKAKLAAPPTRAADLDRYEAEMRDAVRGGLESVVEDTDRARVTSPPVAVPFQDELVIAQALADLGQRKSTWGRSHLYHAISMRLPDHLALPPAQIPALLSQLTEEALGSREVVSVAAPAIAGGPPPSLRDARTGRSVFEPPEAARWTTASLLRSEDSLVDRQEQRGAPTIPAGTVRAVLAERHELNGEQTELAVDVSGDDHRLVTIEAPAGAGKSRVMGALSDLSEQVYGHGLVGFTTAQNAAQVLAREGVGRAHNIAAYLDFLDRAAEGRVTDTERATFAVPRDATVVVDEVTLVDTPRLTRLLGALDDAGVGKVVLIGDTEQAQAVDASGAFAMLLREREPYRLEQVQRFRHGWEGPASVELREGRAEVLAQYEANGRLHGSTDPERVLQSAVDAFVVDHLDDKQSIIVAPNGDMAADLASRARVQLVAAGRVTEDGVTLHDGNLAGVGDRIATRHNDRSLGVVNREQWEVVGTTDHGAIEARRDEGRDPVTGEQQWGPVRNLPADYAAAYVELGYAGTVEAVQGRSTWSGHLVGDQSMGRSRFYPGLSRGAETNHAWLVLEERDKDSPAQTPLERAVEIVERDDREEAARVYLAEEQDRAENLGTLGPIWQQLVTDDAARAHVEAVRAGLPEIEAARVLADPDAGGLLRLLRAAEGEGRKPELVVAAARQRGGSLEGLRSPARGLYARIDQLMTATPTDQGPRGYTYADRVRPTELGAEDNAERAWALKVAKEMDERTVALGQRTLEEWPAWAELLWGPVPDDPLDRAGLGGRAAPVAAYREQYGWTDPVDPIGPQPTRNEPERLWAWNRAADTIGMDRGERDLAGLPVGELANRVQQWEREQAWMAPNRDRELERAHVDHQRARSLDVWARAQGREDPELASASWTAAERVRQYEEVAASRQATYRDPKITAVRVAAEQAQAELARRAEVEEARQDIAVPRPVSEREEQPEDRYDVGAVLAWAEARQVEGPSLPLFGSERYLQLPADDPQRESAVAAAAVRALNFGEPLGQQRDELYDRIEASREQALGLDRDRPDGKAMALRTAPADDDDRTADLAGDEHADELLAAHADAVDDEPARMTTRVLEEIRGGRDEDDAQADVPQDDTDSVLAVLAQHQDALQQRDVPEVGTAAWVELDDDDPSKYAAAERGALDWWNAGDDLDEVRARADAAESKAAAVAVADAMADQREERRQVQLQQERRDREDERLRIAALERNRSRSGWREQQQQREREEQDRRDAEQQRQDDEAAEREQQRAQVEQREDDDQRDDAVTSGAHGMPREVTAAPVDELAARREEKAQRDADARDAAAEAQRAAQAQREADADQARQDQQRENDDAAREERAAADREQAEQEAAEERALQDEAARADADAEAAQQREDEQAEEQQRADVDDELAADLARAQDAMRILAERNADQQAEDDEPSAPAPDDSRDDQYDRVDD